MIKLTLVRLRNHGISVEAERVDDHITAQALEFAGNLFNQGSTFTRALIDRFDGLVLIGPDGNYHFTTPVCGYDGDGTRTAAIIVELFGFGDGASIMARINHGGDGAKAEFNR